MKNVAVPLLLLTTLWSGCGRNPSTEMAAPAIRGDPIEQTPVPSAASAPVLAQPEARPPTAQVPKTAYPLVGFDQLASYTFEVSDELMGPVTNNVEAIAARSNGQIPESIKAFNQRAAAIRGFMLPLKVESGLVTELLIMKDQSMCCYGVTPKINEWVSVKMTEKGVKPIMDQPVTLFGRLHIGETRENGYLIGIYRMDGEKMEAPEN